MNFIFIIDGLIKFFISSGNISVLEMVACFANIAVILAAVYAAKQFKEMRKSTQAQSYTLVITHLQNEEVREARRMVFSLENIPFNKWYKNNKARRAAEIVCHTYDAVGQMVRNNFLQRKIIFDSWGPSLRRSWPILAPLVQKYRREFLAEEYWDDYEWLYLEALKYKQRKP